MSLLKNLALAGVALAAAAAPVFADNVYVRLNDGRVMYVPRANTTVWTRQGGTVIRTLPAGYVNQPYTQYSGSPVYYDREYWYTHKKHWKNDNGWWRDRDRRHRR